MRRSRFAEEQIIGILKGGEAGANIGELCRRDEISKERATIAGRPSTAAWRSARRGGCGQNRRLKHLVADLTLDKQTLQELVRKKF